MPSVHVDFVTKLLIKNINGSNNNENNIYLAALNTTAKYNKILSFWETCYHFVRNSKQLSNENKLGSNR